MSQRDPPSLASRSPVMKRDGMEDGVRPLRLQTLDGAKGLPPTTKKTVTPSSSSPNIPDYGQLVEIQARPGMYWRQAKERGIGLNLPNPNLTPETYPIYGPGGDQPQKIILTDRRKA